MRAAVAFLVASLVIAGCAGDPPPATPSAPSPSDAAAGGCDVGPSTTTEVSAGFMGSRAFAHAWHLACDGQGRPAARVPGTAGRDGAAAYLAGALREAGWNASFENFTGRQYDALGKGSVDAFAKAPYCKGEDRDRMLDLAFANVVGELGSGGRLHILMAHYDSKRFATKDQGDDRLRPVPGANDGASGVGVWLEAARVLRGDAGNDTLRILLVDGEDGFEDCHPLAGSIYHANGMGDADRGRVASVLLLDMVGDADAAYCYAGNSDSLRERIKDAARALNAAALAGASTCTVFDDHTAFTDLGLPAVDVIDFARSGTGFPPYWHTVRDTVDKLDPAMLDSVGAVIVRVVREITAA